MKLSFKIAKLYPKQTDTHNLIFGNYKLISLIYQQTQTLEICNNHNNLN
jgi:hypothetical protein